MLDLGRFAQEAHELEPRIHEVANDAYGAGIPPG